MFMCYKLPLKRDEIMSLHEFMERLSRAQVSENVKKWMPKWLGVYASCLGQDSDQRLTLNEPDVLTLDYSQLVGRNKLTQTVPELRSRLYVTKKVKLPTSSKLRLRCSGNGVRDLVPAYVHSPG